jgi:hypothetical protein
LLNRAALAFIRAAVGAVRRAIGSGQPGSAALAIASPPDGTVVKPGKR